MKNLSTGHPSTLDSYLKLAKAFFGTGSHPVVFLENKISKALNGKDEKVIQDESQVLYLLTRMFQKSKDENENSN